jgi:ABC-type proline/glycine betaine transport system permease subunit
VLPGLPIRHPIREVDVATVEAADGMCFEEQRRRFGGEIPLGSHVMLTGIRLAVIVMIAATNSDSLVTTSCLGRFKVGGLFATDRAGRVAQPLSGLIC